MKFCVLANLSFAIKNGNFLGYIFVGVILLGGFGIWLPAIVPSGELMDLTNPGNHLTYSCAILITLLVEIVLVNNNETSDNFGFGLIFGAITILLSIIGYSKDIPCISVTGTLFAIIICATVTANKEIFREKKCIKQSISSATGFDIADIDKLNKGE